MQNIKYIIVSIILFILYNILQVNIFSHLPILGIIPNLFVIFIIYLAVLSYDNITPSILAVIFGGIYDVCYGSFLGLYALIGFVIVTVVVTFCNRVSVEPKIGMMLYVGIISFFVEIFLGIMQILLTGAAFILQEFVITVLVASIYNFILTLLIHPVFSGYIKERNNNTNILGRYR